MPHPLPGADVRELGRLRWPEVPEPRPVVLLPLGSTEQHGPHLPLDTDTRIAVAVAHGVAARLPGLVVAPPLAYGASGEHAGFPGTLSLGTTALTSVLIELLRSADDTATSVVLVNGHGGNAAALRAATRRLTAEGRQVLTWAPRTAVVARAGVSAAAADLHAGQAETSLLLHLAPDLVRLDAAVRGPSPSIGDLVRQGVRPLSPTGVLGDPTGASAALGAALLAEFIDDAVRGIAAWPGYPGPLAW
ncbi:MAG: mycofactocin biosynthesis peptidyl-dipeptidase MftE [Frankia sp.]|nr:mycofactocin biosynthesis peptidyl-dipeptidase MftE [Frankia sp.]